MKPFQDPIEFLDTEPEPVRDQGWKLALEWLALILLGWAGVAIVVWQVIEVMAG